MRVHHLNCGTLCPRPAQLVNGAGGFMAAGRLVCHCLLLETREGLVLVDTGLGTRDVADPRRLGPMRALLAPRLDERECAIARVRALGFSPGDVRHIVVTHADLDHVGGIDDFPHATVHLFADEYRAITTPTPAERRRYRFGQWGPRTRFEPHPVSGERFEGFECVRPIAGLDEVLLVPLVGHTRGHAGVAVHGADGWLLHAGDAYFHRSQLEPKRTYMPVGLRLFQAVAAQHGRARQHNLERLRRLRAERGTEISIVCAHDPMELDVCAKTAAGL